MRLWVALLPVLLLACSTDNANVAKRCPPAPFRWPDGGALVCDFTAECDYAIPVFLGTPDEDRCDGRGCICCTSSDAGVGCANPNTSHQFICLSPLVGCYPQIAPVCPADAIQGAACTQDDAGPWQGNHECLVLGPGADLSVGVVNGQACACDFPGPIWRCVPAATTLPQ